MMFGMLGNYYFSRLLNVIFHQNNLNPSVTHQQAKSSGDPANGLNIKD